MFRRLYFLIQLRRATVLPMLFLWKHHWNLSSVNQLLPSVFAKFHMVCSLVDCSLVILQRFHATLADSFEGSEVYHAIELMLLEYFLELLLIAKVASHKLKRFSCKVDELQEWEKGSRKPF